jgi:hypothetical protein
MKELEAIGVDELMLALEALNQSELLKVPINPASVMSMPEKFVSGDLKVAMKALNDTGLLEAKMKVIGKKEALQESFLAALKEVDGKEFPVEVFDFLKQPLVSLFTESIEELSKGGADLPVEAINFYNLLYGDEAEAAKKDPPAQKPDKSKGPSKASLRKENTVKWRGETEKLIGKGKHTAPQIADKVCGKYDFVTRSTVLTALSDSKNPKYNVFPSLAEVDENGVFSFKE